MYTLLHLEHCTHEPSVDVVVYYDNSKDRFFVTSTEKDSGCYVVKRSELLGELFKYENEIISEILSGIPENDEFMVLLTNVARNSIALIYESNRLMY